VVWRYKDLRGHVVRSVSLVTPEKARRRVIYLNNPGWQDVAAEVGWIYAGLQVMNPGETARLGVIEGDLVVDVERLAAGQGVSLPASMLGLIDTGRPRSPLTRLQPPKKPPRDCVRRQQTAPDWWSWRKPGRV